MLLLFSESEGIGLGRSSVTRELPGGGKSPLSPPFPFHFPPLRTTFPPPQPPPNPSSLSHSAAPSVDCGLLLFTASTPQPPPPRARAAGKRAPAPAEDGGYSGSLLPFVDASPRLSLTRSPAPARSPRNRPFLHRRRSERARLREEEASTRGRRGPRWCLCRPRPRPPHARCRC